MEQIIFQSTTPYELQHAIVKDLSKQLNEFKKELLSKNANDELLTREETCKLLKIDLSTLWSWTKKGKLTTYGISNRRYYKRSEILDSLITLKQ